MGKKGFFGRLAARYLNRQGLVMLYCGYDAPSSLVKPIPDFTFKHRRTITTPENVVVRKSTDAEFDSHIASWTMWFAGWPVPLDAVPLVGAATADEPLGSLSVIASSIVGVAVHHAGSRGKTYILRMPANGVTVVPEWSLSAAEFASIIMNAVPSEAIVGEIPANTVAALAALPPFGYLGIPGVMAKGSPPDNPARFYREATRQVCLRYQSLVGSGARDESHFRSYLEQRYQEETEHLARLKQDGLPREQEPLARLGLLILAVGLFSYGRLDVVENILDSVPPPELRVGRLAWSLIGTLPLPEPVIDVQVDTERVREWFGKHRDALRWNEQRGVFVLT